MDVLPFSAIGRAAPQLDDKNWTAKPVGETPESVKTVVAECRRRVAWPRTTPHWECAAFTRQYYDWSMFSTGPTGERLPPTYSIQYEQLMRTLYWKSRQQAICWDVFVMLHDRGFLDVKRCFSKHIDTRAFDDNIFAAVHRLDCFTDLTEGYRSPGETLYYQDHVQWLAIMIVRGVQRGTGLWDCIRDSGIVGKPLTREKWAKVSSEPCRSDRKAGLSQRPTQLYGFWLPCQGHKSIRKLSDEELLQHMMDVSNKAVSFHKEIENAYLEMFGIADENLEADETLYHSEDEGEPYDTWFFKGLEIDDEAESWM